MNQPLDVTFDVEEWFTLSVVDSDEQGLALPRLHRVLDRDHVLLSLDHPLGQVGHREPDPFDVVPNAYHV